MLGILGMQGILASSSIQAEGGWPATLLGHVDEYRNGPPDDDTLVIEIYRPLTRGSGRQKTKKEHKDAATVSP